jgi:hypothetical protein
MLAMTGLAMTARARLLALPLACAATFAAASAAEFKDFRDWYVGCDNLRNCSAFGFEADDPSAAWMRIERSGAPAASARITIAADVNEKTRVELVFDDAALGGLPAGPLTPEKGDDQPFGRVIVDDPAAVETLIASLRKAQTIVVRRLDPPGAEKSDPQTSRISLSGAVAALLWIDEQQQRLGTAAAFIRRGDRPASSIPPQPKAPAVQAAKAPAGAAPKPQAAELRVLTARARALCADDTRTELDDSARLSRDVSLHIFGCPDMSGMYNRTGVALIAPDGRPQEARAGKFVYPAEVAGNDHASGGTVTNAGFDQGAMTLSTFNKGRGLGDCGVAEDWVWDGHAFRLVLLRAMAHCKGIGQDDWPVLYRAERR